MSASLCSIAQDGRAVSLHPWWPKDRPPETLSHSHATHASFCELPFLLAVEGRSFPVPTSQAQGTRPTDQVKCFPRFLQAIAQERSKPNHRATSVRKELWNARMPTYFSCMTVIPRYPLIGCVQLLWFICCFDSFDSFNAFNLISLCSLRHVRIPLLLLRFCCLFRLATFPRPSSHWSNTRWTGQQSTNNEKIFSISKKRLW